MRKYKKPPRLGDLFRAMGIEIFSEMRRYERHRSNPRLREAFHETARFFIVPHNELIRYVDVLLLNLAIEKTPLVQQAMAYSFSDQLRHCEDYDLVGVRQAHYLLLQDVLMSLSHKQPDIRETEAVIMFAAMQLMRADTNVPPHFCFDLILRRIHTSLHNSEHNLSNPTFPETVTDVVGNLHPELASKEYVKYNLSLFYRCLGGNLTQHEKQQIEYRDYDEVQPHILAAQENVATHNENIDLFQRYAVDGLKRATQRGHIQNYQERGFPNSLMRKTLNKYAARCVLVPFKNLLKTAYPR